MAFIPRRTFRWSPPRAEEAGCNKQKAHGLSPWAFLLAGKSTAGRSSDQANDGKNNHDRQADAAAHPTLKPPLRKRTPQCGQRLILGLFAPVSS